MEKRVVRMYLVDCATIMVSMVLTWAVMALVLRTVLGLTSDLAVRATIEIAAATAAVFATSALIAVLVHLRRNRETLYAEDVAHLKEGGRL
jgi:hypothetical protein